MFSIPEVNTLAMKKSGAAVERISSTTKPAGSSESHVLGVDMVCRNDEMSELVRSLEGRKGGVPTLGRRLECVDVMEGDVSDSDEEKRCS